MPIIRLIAAIDDKNGIAKDGKLPWNLPSDRQYFRDQIEDSTILMGWNTFKSNNFQAFPNAKNIILSSKSETQKNVRFITEIKLFLKLIKVDLWVIGGGQVFAQLIPRAQELYLTRVKGDFNCDVFFPEFESDFHRVHQSVQDKENGTEFCYEVWERNY